MQYGKKYFLSIMVLCSYVTLRAMEEEVLFEQMAVTGIQHGSLIVQGDTIQMWNNGVVTTLDKEESPNFAQQSRATDFACIDDNTFLVLFAEKNIEAHDAQTKKCIGCLQTSFNGLKYLKYAPALKLLFLIDANTITSYFLKNGSKEYFTKMEEHDFGARSIHAFAFNEMNGLLYLTFGDDSSYDHAIYRYNLEQDDLERCIADDLSQQPISSLCIAHDNEKLFSVSLTNSSDGTIGFWDLKNKCLKRAVNVQNYCYDGELVTQLAITPDDTTLAFASLKMMRVDLFNVATCELIKSINALTIPIAFSLDSKTLAGYMEQKFVEHAIPDEKPSCLLN